MTVLRVSTKLGPKKQVPSPKVLSQVEMSHHWTHHAFRMAHDGRSLVAHRKDGIEVFYGPGMKRSKRVRMDLLAHNPRTFLYHPNNKRVAFWAPVAKKHWNRSKRVAIMKLDGAPPSGKGAYKVLYAPPKRSTPTGLEWSPQGDALFIMERMWEDDLGYSVIKRIDAKTGKATEIVRRLGEIDFFMPPISRFENGRGVSKAPFSIVYGTSDGLYVTDPEGKSKRRLSAVPALGLTNAEWHPVRNQITIFFERAVPGPDGKTFRGLYMVDIGNAETEAKVTQLHPNPDVHTLWYSPRGTYVLWANAVEVFYRNLDAGETKSFAAFNAKGAGRLIRGVSFNEDETKLVYCVEGEVRAYDLKERFSVPVANIASGFTAEPRWVGEDVVFSVYEDILAEITARRANPTLQLNCKPKPR